MNVIVRLEFELTYYDSAVHYFNHYTTMTSPYVVANVLNIHIIESEFELQSNYYAHLRINILGERIQFLIIVFLSEFSFS